MEGFSTKKPVRPGLYNIDFHIFANITGATPDGRKFRDPIGEHCCPTPGTASEGPTAVIRSASRLPMAKGYASSPLQLTLDQGGLGKMGADPEEILKRLMEGARQAGVPVFNLAMYDKKTLRAAQEEEEIVVAITAAITAYYCGAAAPVEMSELPFRVRSIKEIK